MDSNTNCYNILQIQFVFLNGTIHGMQLQAKIRNIHHSGRSTIPIKVKVTTCLPYST